MQDPLPEPSNVSISARLAQLFGPQVDPQVSLTPLTDRAAAAEVVEDLLGRGDGQQRYEQRGEIDRGGMGRVLEVYDRDLRRSLAMKVVLEDELGAAPSGRRVARFLEEAQITAQLDHPGVVPVHELGLTQEGRVFFTMRRVRGRDLREVLHCVHFGLDGWSEARALSVLLRVCEAVAFAHSRGVIHRDLKPANIMVGAYGEVYVMDWGLARVVGREDSALESSAASETPSASEAPGMLSTILRDERARSPVSPLVTLQGDVLGTPAYMPPEQAGGALSGLTPRADVYAIGAMLYHLLAHEPPYYPAGRGTTQVEALRALRQGPPRRLDEARPGVAGELVAICEKAMAFDEADRYADVGALASDLRAFLEQRVVAAYQTGAWTEARLWVRRNRSLAAASAAALVVLVLGLVATTTQYLRAETSADLAREEALRADGEARAARSSEERARQSEELARAETAKVLRLADAQRLKALEREADGLWPAVPSRSGAMGSWCRRAEALLANLPQHREELDSLRKRAEPYDAETRRKDREEHPLAPELASTREALDSLHAGRVGLGGDALARAQQRVASLEQRLATLEVAVEARRTWNFDDVELQWQHDLLRELVAGLERLADEDPGVGALAGVRRRAEFAAGLEEHSLTGAAPATLWRAAREAVASSPSYAGLDLGPQLGLLPLGPDPDSGLWEFAHLASGEAARRGPAGALKLTEATGVVLVLIPSGRFAMGCQAEDPSAAHFDTKANIEESPVHELELGAFFLSKYELTQAQWLRATGTNPSAYGPQHYAPSWNRDGRPASLLHPVEQVSWDDCARVLPRLDLGLPTEAQWEYAARAGTHGAWWTGDEVVSLQGACNLADRFGVDSGAAGWPAYELELDDGETCHAPVGSFRANAFGLYDTAGNVFEWCGDGYGLYGSPAREGDGARAGVTPEAHPRRGGGWSHASSDARSGARNPGAAGFLSDVLGVRPARPLR